MGTVFFRPRAWYSLVVLICAGLIAYALYLQHVEFLDPCPLCILQRMAFIWIAVAALLAAVHNPAGSVRWIYGALVMVGGLLGAVVAGRHLWLQNLPAEQVPDCGMGLNYMLETLPLGDVFRQVFYGSGECAEIHWVFLGLSMPAWTMICYIGIIAVTWVVVSRHPAK